MAKTMRGEGGKGRATKKKKSLFIETLKTKAKLSSRGRGGGVKALPLLEELFCGFLSFTNDKLSIFCVLYFLL